MPRQVRVRRVYDDVAPDDGLRVLVDRVWPRGLKKDAAHLDEWAKDVAPSNQLRIWYGHQPERFTEFRRRYLTELREPQRQEVLKRLRTSAGKQSLTLLTATRDVEHSQAEIIAQQLRDGA